MKALYLSFFFIFALIIPGYSQNAVVFEKYSHDFGNIKEDGGLVRTSFSFINASNTPIKILKVSVACGCTSSNWPKGDIAPGVTSTVEVSYDPMNRPGSFEKEIDLSLGNDTQVQLKINGHVMPRTKDFRELFPTFIGNLRFEASHIASGFLYSDSSKRVGLKVYNPTDRAITIDWDKSKFPTFISAAIKGKQTVVPKDSLEIAVIYDGRKRNDWEYLKDSFTMATDDIDSPKKELFVLIYMKERFSNQGPQAKLQLGSKEHDFGQIPYGSKQKVAVKITNTGQKTLFVRKILYKCDCFSFKVPKEGISPGSSATIEVTFNTEKLAGSLFKSFSILSNDPDQTNQMFLVKANILPK